MAEYTVEIIHDYLQAINGNKPELLEQVTTPQYTLQTQTMGKLTRPEVMNLLGFFCHSMVYAIDNVLEINPTTCIAVGTVELLFLPEKYYRKIPLRNIIKFKSGLIDSADILVKYTAEESEMISAIFTDRLPRSNTN